jgi:hypothetical protein
MSIRRPLPAVIRNACIAGALVGAGCGLSNPAIQGKGHDGGPDATADGGKTGAGGSVIGAGGTGASGGHIGSGGNGGTAGAGGGAGQSGSGAGGGTAGARTGPDSGMPDASTSVPDASIPDASGPDACDSHHANCAGGGSSCDTSLDDDPHHCGACGHDCLGGDCKNGTCLPLELSVGSSISGFPKGLAVGPNGVYWTDVVFAGDTEAGIFSCPLAGCGNKAPTALAPNLGQPMWVTASSDEIYWLDAKGTRAAQCPLTGCGSSATTCVSGQNEVGLIVNDGASIYWTNQGTAANSHGDGQVMRASISDRTMCANVEELANGLHWPTSIVIDGATLYWLVAPTNDAAADGKILSCGVAGCNKMPATTVGGLLRPIWVTARGGKIFWASDSTRATDGSCNSDGAIYACSNCRGVGKSLHSNLACPSYPTFDGTHLYWVDQVTKIQRSRPDGSNVEPFVANADYIVAMTADDEAIYWLELGGSVWKKAK